MTLPDVFVDTIDVQPTIDQSDALHQLLLVAPFQKGPTTPLRAFSLAEVIRQRGPRQSYSLGIDEVESYFRECGDGGTVITQRAVGADSAPSHLALSSSAPAVVVNVYGASDGVWADKLALTVTTPSGSNRTVVLDHDDDGVLLTGTYATAAALRTALESTGQVVTTLGVGTWPIANLARTHLTGGDDDHDAIDDDDYQTAIDGLDPRLGPGMVDIAGATTDSLHEIIETHCETIEDRVPVCSHVDTAVAGDLVASVATIRARDTAKLSGNFAPWLLTPDGREVPPSGAVAGLIARNFLATGNPNQAAAGDNGQLQWHVGLTHDLEASREQLNDAGVNVIRDVDGQGTLQLYGFRTAVSPATDTLNLQFSNVLLDKLIVARAKKIGRTMEFQQIDGKGLLASKYGGRLDDMLKDLWDPLNALFGATKQEAYQVDVGTSVNTPTTAAAGQLKARIAVRRSPFAEQTFLNITIYGVTEAIA